MNVSWERQPRDYRKACEAAAKVMRSGTPGMAAKGCSPQNRRVRFAVDTDLARAKLFPNRETRQQRRHAQRKGYRIVARGPEEV